MFLDRSFIFCFVILWFWLYTPSQAGDKTIVLQRPMIDFVNSTFARLINITSGRYSRKDPVYYNQLCAQTFIPLNKQSTVRITIDEYLSYASKRRFIEIEKSVCDFTVMALKNLLYKKSITDDFKPRHVTSDCVMPAGFYYLYNLTMTGSVPLALPFVEGRIEFKIISKDKALLGSLHLDLSNRVVTKSKASKSRG